MVFNDVGEIVAAELGDVVSGKKPGRGSAEEIILYESPGMGILDAGIGHWVYHRAKQKGLGTELLKSLVEIGRREKVRKIVGHILRNNTGMKRVSEEVGFVTQRDSNNDWRAEIQL